MVDENTLEFHFKNQGIKIILFPDKISKTFSSFKTFEAFIVKEFEYWKPCTSGILLNVRNYFQNIVNEINHAKSLAATKYPQACNHLDQAVKLASQNQIHCVYSQSPISKLLLEIFNQEPTQINGAYLYLFQTGALNLNDRNMFLGVMKAYHFQHLNALVENKLNMEKESLKDIRERYINTTDSFEKYYTDKIKKTDNEIAEFKKYIEDWKENIIEKFDSKNQENQEIFNNLKTTYEEKLRIQGPAKYWKDFADEYNKRGQNWRNWAIGSSSIMILFITLILYKIPNCLKKAKLFSSFESIRGFILLTLAISLFIYMIRLFVKLSISAYHLYRDAMERYQLSHIYLSLIKEKLIEPKERDIILQALFSRADTGLLKGDSSPTLPGGMLNEILKNIGK